MHWQRCFMPISVHGSYNYMISTWHLSCLQWNSCPFCCLLCSLWSCVFTGLCCFCFSPASTPLSAASTATPSGKYFTSVTLSSSTSQHSGFHYSTSSNNTDPMSPELRGMSHSHSGITPTSGADLLRECVEWVDQKRVSSSTHVFYGMWC